MYSSYNKDFLYMVDILNKYCDMDNTYHIDYKPGLFYKKIYDDGKLKIYKKRDKYKVFLYSDFEPYK